MDDLNLICALEVLKINDFLYLPKISRKYNKETKVFETVDNSEKMKQFKPGNLVCISTYSFYVVRVDFYGVWISSKKPEVKRVPRVMSGWLNATF